MSHHGGVTAVVLSKIIYGGMRGWSQRHAAHILDSLRCSRIIAGRGCSALKPLSASASVGSAALERARPPLVAPLPPRGFGSPSCVYRIAPTCCGCPRAALSADGWRRARGRGLSASFLPYFKTSSAGSSEQTRAQKMRTCAPRRG